MVKKQLGALQTAHHASALTVGVIGFRVDGFEDLGFRFEGLGLGIMPQPTQAIGRYKHSGLGFRM